MIGLVDSVGLVAYFLLTAIFGYLVRRSRSFSDFSVGNRSLPGTLVFASLAATYIGPGFSMGFAGDAFGRGYLLYLLALAYPLQVLAVALFVAPQLSTYKSCHTIGDVMALKYGRLSHLCTGIISVGLCIGFTAIMGKAGGHLLQSATGWWTPALTEGDGQNWGLYACIAIVTLSTALVTFAGGLRAVVATESLHFVWISVVIPIVAVLALFRHSGGADGLQSEAIGTTSRAFSEMTGLAIAGVVVSFALGEMLIPPYANRALAAKDATASRSGFALAAAYCVVWLAVIAAIGIAARDFLPADTAPDTVLLLLGKQLLPAGLYGLLVGACIAIVMSSQESVLNSAAVALTRDVLQVKDTSDRMALRISRIGTLAIALAATALALAAPSIIEGLLICYSIWAPSMVIPLVAGLYITRTRPLAGWLSMLLGGGASGMWQLLGEPGGWPAILIGLVASAAGYIIGHVWGSPARASLKERT